MAFKMIEKNERGYKKYNNLKENKIKKGKSKIIFSVSLLIKRNDNDVDNINNVPYTQALRIDKRNMIQILLSVVISKIGFLNLFFEENPYSHLSLDISIYLFELLLDLTMNCLLYSDDVVSEKYNNNGELSMITSLSLSIISNIISSIINFILLLFFLYLII